MTAAVTPDVERQLTADMLRRGLPAAPVVLLIAGLISGWAGVASAGYGMAIVALNLVLAAFALGWAARVSPAALMATALGGFLLRMGLVTVAILLVRHSSWADLKVVAVTVLGAQLGLLFWETRYVSASLAFPGVKPAPGKGL